MLVIPAVRDVNSVSELLPMWIPRGSSVNTVQIRSKMTWSCCWWRGIFTYIQLNFKESLGTNWVKSEFFAFMPCVRHDLTHLSCVLGQNFCNESTIITYDGQIQMISGAGGCSSQRQAEERLMRFSSISSIRSSHHLTFLNATKPKLLLFSLL